jgi:23S rRNA pseudouridine1911/1915/1917 synthase
LQLKGDEDEDRESILRTETPSLTPSLIEETPAYLVVFKPPRLHSVPLKRGSDTATLLDWCASLFPETLLVCGKSPWEGGILHRLDYETQGLVLVARTQDALDALNTQQSAGLFIKEYSALVHGALVSAIPQVIKSGFRPFGPGRKVVRPVLGETYQTEILGTELCGEYTRFHLRIRRGFRHQIRSHLAWLGYPIVNDALYGSVDTDGYLGLCASAFSFRDPVSGEARRYSIDGETASLASSASITGVLSSPQNKTVSS